VFPGDRVVRVGDLTIPVDPSGVVTSAEALASLAQSDSYVDFRAKGMISSSDDRGADASSPSGMSVQYELAEPVSVMSVPAAALYGTKADRACVIGDGRPTSVTIVGSQLGQTFVIPENGAAFSVVSLATGEKRPCG
jgi:hypothetical protein